MITDYIYPSLPDFLWHDYRILVRVTRRSFGYYLDGEYYLSQLEDVIRSLVYHQTSDDQRRAGACLYALIDLFSGFRGHSYYQNFIFGASRWLNERHLSRAACGYRRVRPLRLNVQRKVFDI